jgi:uncharacterized lipoprotein YbaY/heat shock protein HslJ
MTYPKALALLLGAAVLGGCGSSEPETGTVSGKLEYRERIMLTPEAVATVTLEDVSLADAPAKVIARQEIANPGAPPIAFALEYPLDAIDERMTYSVRAQIHDRGRLLFTSDTHAPVLTRGAGNTVDLLLVRAVNSSATAPRTGNASGGTELAGMFRYMADAALFRDCRSNKVFPVAMEGAYKDLESAYLNSLIEPGEELMVNVEGRFLKPPTMMMKTNNINLIVDSFIAIYPERTCVDMADATLLNTYWKLVSVEGREVVTPEDQREAHMVLATDEARVRGNAGCNNFFGGYETEGDTLAFGALGSTMMACPEGMDTERAFLAALEATERYELKGETLALYAGDQVVARFEAVYLR